MHTKPLSLLTPMASAINQNHPGVNKLGPGISLSFALEDNNPELLGHLLRATDDRADFLG